jgi:hypothetical protein
MRAIFEDLALTAHTPRRLRLPRWPSGFRTLPRRPTGTAGDDPDIWGPELLCCRVQQISVTVMSRRDPYEAYWR